MRQRNVAMVYQQFINYPTLTVYENIASPLRVAKLSRAEVEARVSRAAGLLQLQDLLSRYPDALSGGQQQRVAIARALVKEADLVLLDEPLANLDYKLREELRSQLPTLFAEQGVVLVYATTEPMEALALGGMTACLSEGRVAQFGPTLELYNAPAILQSAKSFSDPPLNTVALQRQGDQFYISREDDSTQSFKPDGPIGSETGYTLAIRPHHLSLKPESEMDLKFNGTVTVTELTGSESFIHFDCNGNNWVALVHGICELNPGQEVTLHVNPDKVFVFDQAQRLVPKSVVRGVS